MRLLIAEDDPTFRRMLEAMLVKWGYEVVVTVDGTEAWETLQDGDSPALVILDWMMPGMDGIDVCRKIRESRTMEPKYVILLTRREDKEDIVAGLRAGADDYIVKPFDKEELHARIQVGERVIALQSDLALKVKEIRQSEARYRAIFEATGTGMLIIDEDTKISMANQEVERLFGYRREDLEGKKTWGDLIPDNQSMREGAVSPAEKPIHQGSPKIDELTLRSDDGNIRTISLNMSAIPGTGKQVVSLIDITARKHIEEALRKSEQRYMELSITDDLTKLFNSRHCYDQLTFEIERSNRYGNPLTLLLLDVDSFKRYNDEHGHLEGDKVLIRLADVIRKCSRSTDSAFRYGGEEFIMILRETDGDQGRVIAERIRQEFRDEVFYPEQKHQEHVTVSIGVARFTPREDIKNFIRRADHCMYLAKRQGKDCVVL